MLGLSTLGKVHTLEGECPNNTCSSQVYANDLASARTFVTATDITLLAGGVVAAAGLTWLLLSAPHTAESSSAPRVGGACVGTGCYATLHVRF